MAKKIILKENGLVGSGTTPSGYKFIGDNDGNISQKIGATVSGIGLGYKSFEAFITQTGTNEVEVSIVHSDFPDNAFEISRCGVGTICINTNFEMPENKTALIVGRSSFGGSNFGLFTFNREQEYVIELKSYTLSSGAFVLTDGLHYDNFIEIRVYP
jgi:hypothetical protein